MKPVTYAGSKHIRRAKLRMSISLNMSKTIRRSIGRLIKPWSPQSGATTRRGSIRKRARSISLSSTRGRKQRSKRNSHAARSACDHALCERDVLCESFIGWQKPTRGLHVAVPKLRTNVVDHHRHLAAVCSNRQLPSSITFPSRITLTVSESESTTLTCSVMW